VPTGGQAVYGQCSYAANGFAFAAPSTDGSGFLTVNAANDSFRNTFRVTDFVDGLSKTVLFTEKLANCGTVGGSRWADWTYPTTTTPAIQSVWQPAVEILYTENAANTAFASYLGYNQAAPGTAQVPFLSRPTAAHCGQGFNYTLPSTYHPGVINVLMGDGSVRTVFEEITGSTWFAAMTANGNDFLGQDWNF
jgi:prepilin-type processing-associated H-X9-DG protein